MKLKNILIITFLITGFTVFSQTKAATLKRDAQKLAKATVLKNHEEVVAYSHPKIIELLGGKDKMILSLSKLEKQFTIEKVRITEPRQMYTAGNETHCLIGQVVTFKYKKTKLVLNSYLLGISKNDGKNWTFIDAATITNENIKEVLPNFNDALIIPKKQMPVEIKDE